MNFAFTSLNFSLPFPGAETRLSYIGAVIFLPPFSSKFLTSLPPAMLKISLSPGVGILLAL